MLKVFTIIDYVLKAKQGVEKPEELLADTSFSFLEFFFYVSFALLGLFTAALWFFTFFKESAILGFFATLFSLALAFDIFLFIKIKKFFARMSKKIVDYGKQKMAGSEYIEVEIIEEY